MHSAFNLFVFPNSMFTPLLLFGFFKYIFYERAMSSPEKLHLKITIIIIIWLCAWVTLMDMLVGILMDLIGFMKGLV